MIRVIELDMPGEIQRELSFNKLIKGVGGGGGGGVDRRAHGVTVVYIEFSEENWRVIPKLARCLYFFFFSF